MKTKTLLISGLLLFIITGAGLRWLGDVNYMTPAPDHFVSPLRSDIAWGPVKTVRSFFPAQANIQWLAGVNGYGHPVGGAGSKASHGGSSTVVSGTMTCRNCHETTLESGDFAADLVNTPEGIPGKNPYKDVDIQAAYDDEYLYLKAVWSSQRPRPGITHQAYQFLSGSWQLNSKNKVPGKNQISDLGPNEFYSYEDRFSVMLAPKNVGATIKAFGSEGVNFNQAGCFVACHSSLRYMPEAPASASVQADPWLGPGGLNVTDLRHYLLHTRNVNAFADANSSGNWQTTLGAYDANKQKGDFNNQKFLDLWMHRAARSAAMYCGSNDAVLEYRHSGQANTNRGDNAWFDQNLTTSLQPANVNELVYDTTEHVWKDASSAAVNVSAYKWMYDSSKTGYYSVPATAIEAGTGELSLNWTIKFPLIAQGPDRNAIPLDSTKISEGNVLPRQVLRKGSGIRGSLSTFSKWEQSTGKWTVIFRRKLNAAKCDHGSYGDYCSDLDIKADDLKSAGQGLTLAFGIFDDHSTARFHYVSFPFTLQDKSGADIKAQYIYPLNAEEGNLRNTFSLDNYPNPFRTTTEISFSLPEKTKVKLEIYDVTGKLVKILLNQNMNAGAHSVTWDTQTAGKTGVYFCTLHAGNYVETKRLLVVE